MNPRYTAVAGRADHRCEYCRAPEVLFNFPFEVEHIVPKSKNGSGQDSNLALACRGCNLFKSDTVWGTDPESNEEVNLFHPRIEQWGDHFVYDSESRKIEGRSATGRATVARLQMNSDFQLASRRWWTSLGLFP